jgi:hypothetical protein
VTGAHVEHASASSEPLGYARDSWQPGLHQIGRERGPVDATLTFAQRCAVLGIGHTFASAIRGHHLVEHRADAGHQPSERSQVVTVDGVDEDAAVLGGQQIAASRCVARPSHGEKASHGLLFEPLLGVALVDAGDGGELGRSDRTPPVDGFVQSELGADEHGEQLECSDGGVDQAVAQVSSHLTSPLMVVTPGGVRSHLTA